MERIGNRIFVDPSTELLLFKDGSSVKCTSKSLKSFYIVNSEKAEKIDDLAITEFDIVNDINKQKKVALKIAETMFANRKDKGGNPYIEHLKFVSKNSRLMIGAIIGLLHDLIEDTSWTLDDLRDLNMFDNVVIDSVELLTKPNDGDYLDYISNQVILSPYAADVKLADLKNNLDISRLNKITQEDTERMAEYRKAQEVIHNAFPYL